MCDVKWSPTHSALFGTVARISRFDLWNLNADTEKLFVSAQVGSGKALNKLTCVYVFAIGEVRQKININQKFRLLTYISSQGDNA